MAIPAMLYPVTELSRTMASLRRELNIRLLDWHTEKDLRRWKDVVIVRYETKDLHRHFTPRFDDVSSLVEHLRAVSALEE